MTSTRAPYGLAKAQEATIKKLANKGLTSPEIAKRTGLKPQQVHYLRKKLDLPTNGRGRPSGIAPITVERMRVIRQMGSQGLTGAQIARELKLTRERIRQICKMGKITLPVRYARETDTLERIVEASKTNLTTQEVATATGLSLHTIRTYNKKFKLKIADNKEHVRRAMKDREVLIKNMIASGMSRKEMNVALGWAEYSPALLIFCKRHRIKLPYASERYRKTGKKIKAALTGRPSPLKGIKRSTWKSQ